MKQAQIGFWPAAALVAGNMIGSGIFLLPATLAVFGQFSLLGWLVSGTGALLLAYTFARLSRLITTNGGPYAYTRWAFGDFSAFVVAWGYWISLWTGNAAIAIAFVANLTPFFPGLRTNSNLSLLVCLSSIWVATAINLRGVREAARFQLITTALRLLPILLLSTWGFYFFKWENWAVDPGQFSLSDVALQAAALTFWSFLGIESATIPATSIRNPERNISRATWWGTVFSVLVFVASCSAVMGILPHGQLFESTAPFADAAQLIWGRVGYYAVAAAAALSCLGALNGWILLQGQIPDAVAKDGLFPPFFGKENRRGAPANALILSSILMTGMVLLNYTDSLQEQFKKMILLATLANLIPYVFSALAEWVWLLRQGQFRWALHWGLTIRSGLTFAFAMAAILGTGWHTIRSGLILLVLGMPVYWWLKGNEKDFHNRR